MKTTPIEGIGFSGIEISLNLADLVVIRSLLKELTSARDDCVAYNAKYKLIEPASKAINLLNNITKNYSGIDIATAEKELFAEQVKPSNSIDLPA